MAGEFSALYMCQIPTCINYCHVCDYCLCDFAPQVVVIMGLVLQWANLYGYVRCKVGGKSSLRNMAKSYLSRQVFKQVCEVSRLPLLLIYCQNTLWHSSFCFSSKRPWRKQRKVETELESFRHKEVVGLRTRWSYYIYTWEGRWLFSCFFTCGDSKKFSVW